MRRFLTAFLAVALASAPLAALALPTVTELGSTTNNTTVTTRALTTSAAVATGDLVVVMVTHPQSASLVSTLTVTDTALNSYTCSLGGNDNSGRTSICYAANATSMASSGIITAVWLNSASVIMTAYTVTGIATSSPLDQQPATSGGNSIHTFSIATGALAQAAEIVFGQFVTNGSDGGSYVAGTGFTALNSVTMASSTPVQHSAYKLTSSAATSNYDPSWLTDRNVSRRLSTFKQLGGVTASPQNLTLLGVGQ